MQHIEQNIFDTLNPHCFRKPGSYLVYVATLKCASTYYTTLLLDNGWDRIYFTEIDWQKDHVFGFINDPDQRYYKGITEDVNNVAAVDSLEAESLESHIKKTFQDFSPHLLLFSLHTIPINIKLGKYFDKIDWIPIFNDFPHHQIFLKLLNYHNLTVEPGENLDPNSASEYKKNQYLNFKNCINYEMDLYKIFTEGDRELFHSVCNRINPNGKSWQEISWLTNKTIV